MGVIIDLPVITRTEMEKDLKSMKLVFDYLWRTEPMEGNLDLPAHREVVRLIRRQMWERFMQFRTHFKPFGGELLNTDFYIFTGHEWAIRKFGGDTWYLVKVLKYSSTTIETDCPDNYPLHAFPDTVCRADYPEILIAQFLLNNCQPWKE